MLRPYQTRAISRIKEELSVVDSTLLVMATGTGKTVVFSDVANWHYRTHAKPILVLAHRRRLLAQAEKSLVTYGGFRLNNIGWEMADRSVIENPLFGIPHIVLGAVQSLHKKRLEKFARDAFGLIIVDEAHHSVADSYRSVLQHFNGAKVLGVTATPDRLEKGKSDKGRKIQSLYDSIADVYEIRDAIEEEYLVPIIPYPIYVDSIDISQIDTVAGDLNEGRLSDLMEEERNLYAIAQPTIEESGDRPTLVFCTRIEHANKLAEVFNKIRYGCARAISGETDPEGQERAIADLQAGRIQFLLNCVLLTEGVDIPCVSCLSIARPTKSRGLYTQMIGRGTRLLGLDMPESLRNGKSDLLVLDFVGNAGKHKLQTVLDVIDGNQDESIKANALARIKKSGGKLNALQALKDAEKELAETERDRLLRQAKIQVRYRVGKAINPFAVLGIHPRAGRYGGIKPTEPQLAFLQKNGFTANELRTMDKGQATETITAIMSRREKGLCSLKQANRLAIAGINPDLNYDHAHKVMELLAANNWQPSKSIREIAEDFLMREQVASVDIEMPF